MQPAEMILKVTRRFISLSNRLERFYLRRIVGRIGEGSIIYEGVKILPNPENVFIGRHTHIYNEVFLTVGKDARIVFGDYVHLGVRSHLNATAGRIIIGRGTSIGTHVQIHSYMEDAPTGRELQIVIERSCTIADVIIGDCTSLGSGSIILPGVTIGDGAVIGAGSVVIDDVPPYTTVLGVPARKIFIRA